jgi:hypothetical protein
LGGVGIPHLRGWRQLTQLSICRGPTSTTKHDGSTHSTPAPCCCCAGGAPATEPSPRRRRVAVASSRHSLRPRRRPYAPEQCRLSAEIRLAK